MTDPVAAFRHALDLHRQGQLTQALAAYDELLARWPAHAETLHYSGLALYQSGRADAAVERIERSLRSDARAAEPWCNLALAYGALGRHDAAVDALREALQRSPRQAEIWNNLASVLLTAGRVEEAERAARQALELEGAHAPSRFNLALCCEAQGRLDEALANAELALQAAPGAVAPAGLKAQIEETLGRLDAASATLAQAIARCRDDPAAAPLYLQRAAIEQRQGRLSAAAQSLEQTLKLEPRQGAALSELLFLRKQLADWHDLASLRKRFRAGVHAGERHLSPFSFLSDPSSRAEQRRCAEAWSLMFATAERSTRKPGDGVLRIGYLSADFRQHATAVLAAGLFEQHDRKRFIVAAYSTGASDGSAMRARLESGFDRFVDACGWPADRLAEQIDADRIDILVDLKGHTHAAPTSVLALRPAPVQVSYLGFPGTTGASFIDYLVGDAIVTPFAHAADYSETLLQLPQSYQINDRQRPIAPVPPRRALGLPEDAFVFCCFNQSYKFNPEVFDAWARILAAVPRGVLWLLSGNDEITSQTLAANLKREIAAREIDPARLIFAPRRHYAEYLALFRLADLFLDTWPYNAHTIASDALWAGCPVLTWLGETFAGRAGASLLTAVGLPELIAPDVAAYVERAITLASDKSLLLGYRRELELAGHDSALFDTTGTTRALEAVYVQIADQCRHGVREPLYVGSLDG
ncbi:MAG TPA: tetratricopeptide repeat protein [Casimicrobiaceae bacterium]|nr:tetratricopeptide repeat protein [Casimicrobiaceae bacterium]